MKTTKERQAARGQECMVRVPGVCNGDPDTTVLAHYRLLPYCGAGYKPPDDLGAWCCSSCHDFIDGRTWRGTQDFSQAEIKLMHAEGVFRTWMATR